MKDLALEKSAGLRLYGCHSRCNCLERCLNAGTCWSANLEKKEGETARNSFRPKPRSFRSRFACAVERHHDANTIVLLQKLEFRPIFGPPKCSCIPEDSPLKARRLLRVPDSAFCERNSLCVLPHVYAAAGAASAPRGVNSASRIPTKNSAGTSPYKWPCSEGMLSA